MSKAGAGGPERDGVRFSAVAGVGWGMGLSFEIAVVLLLILLNGIFALCELALVSVRRARLMVMQRNHVPGASAALTMSEDPQRFLPTVQVGMTLVSIITGTVGGARIAARLEPMLAQIPALEPVASELALLLVVVVSTYLTLVLGELVPKQLALRRPEVMAARVARPLGVVTRIAAPMVWVLGVSTGLVLRLFGSARATSHSVTEEELKALLAEGRAGRRAGGRRARHDRAAAAAGRQAGAGDHDAAERDRLYRPQRSAPGHRRGAEGGTA